MGEGSKCSYFLRSACRFIQMSLAITVVSLYASSMGHHHFGGRWIFGIVAGVLTTLTTFVYYIPAVQTSMIWWWDLIIAVLWIAVFGSFAGKYMHHKNKTETRLMDDGKMRIAMWLDMGLMITWLLSGLCGVFSYFKGK